MHSLLFKNKCSPTHRLQITINLDIALVMNELLEVDPARWSVYKVLFVFLSDPVLMIPLACNSM